MKLTREELAKALIKGLKLDDNVFNYQAVAEEIECIQEKDFMDFYKAVMSVDTFGNGLKAIINVAEQFKPQDTNLDDRAKKLISFVETQNTNLGELAKQKSIDFNKLAREIKPMAKYQETFDVLAHVPPHYDAKELIINIRHYQTSSDALNAFKQAIISYENQSEQFAIAGSVKKLLQTA